MLVYVDADVFVNIVKNEKDRNGRQLDELSLAFFERCYGCKFRIVTSDLLWSELSKWMADGKLQMVLMMLDARKKRKHVTTHPDDARAYKEYTGPDRADYLHSLIAKRTKVDFLVTRNGKHFEKFSIPTRTPEGC